jgi:hypothetical protein
MKQEETKTIGGDSNTPQGHIFTAKQASKHISQVASKTAQALAGEFLHSDPYHQSILVGARAMVDHGYGQAKYLTQYSSGNTCWTIGGHSKSVTYEGKLESGNVLTAVALAIFGIAVVVSAYLVLTLGVQGIMQVVQTLSSL